MARRRAPATTEEAVKYLLDDLEALRADQAESRVKIAELSERIKLLEAR